VATRDKEIANTKQELSLLVVMQKFHLVDKSMINSPVPR
jgi:hypothetical protein